ncbi:MAG TPA: hypothetical protein VGE07_08235 [Herpetosiphonaceae bacterium]
MPRPTRRQIGDASLGPEIEARIALIAAREEARRRDAARQSAADPLGRRTEGRHARAHAQHARPEEPAAPPQSDSGE